MEPGERADLEAAADFYAAVAEAGVGATSRVAGAVCGTVAALRDNVMVNRVLGLGLERPATEHDLAEVESFFERAGTRYSVSASPAASGLAELLAGRGYQAGYAWMTFRRDLSPYEARSELGLEEVDLGNAGEFARIVAGAYGMPADAEPAIALLAGRPGWHCFLTRDGDKPAGAGAMFVSGNGAWLGFAGTAADHRRKGSQGTILAARIDRARELGVAVLATETGERLPGRPSNSYRNLLRAGFREHHLRPNYGLATSQTVA